MPSQSTNVFVSYSHADAPLVAPVVKLLRANKSLVFQDIDDIQPGKRWRSEIAKGLAESHLVVVFWCDHACRSDEVSKEWKEAIQLEKDLLPLLLDATPLPSELGDFQWIDFRGTVGANHSDMVSAADDSRTSKPRAEALRFRSLLVPFVGVVAVFAVLVAIGMSTCDRPQVPQHPLPAPLPDEPIRAAFNLQVILVGLAVLSALTAFFVWLRRWRAARRELFEKSKPLYHEFERRIASEVEAEILRRTALTRDSGL